MPDRNKALIRRFVEVVNARDYEALEYSATQTGQMGPFPPSGRNVVGPFAGYFRIQDGQLKELFVTWDNVDMLTQLGHFEDAAPGA